MARRSAVSQLKGEALKEQVSEWLCEWFLSRGKFKGDAEKLPAINYFDAGLLTSLEVIEFVSEVEDRFGVRFSELDFQDPRFVTVAGLAELIAGGSTQAVEHN
jgi:acyl carrier protein